MPAFVEYSQPCIAPTCPLKVITPLFVSGHTGCTAGESVPPLLVGLIARVFDEDIVPHEPPDVSKVKVTDVGADADAV